MATFRTPITNDAFRTNTKIYFKNFSTMVAIVHAIFPYHCDKLPVSGEFQVLIMGANKQETDDLRQAMSTRLAPYRAT